MHTDFCKCLCICPSNVCVPLYLLFLCGGTVTIYSPETELIVIALQVQQSVGLEPAQLSSVGLHGERLHPRAPGEHGHIYIILMPAYQMAADIIKVIDSLCSIKHLLLALDIWYKCHSGLLTALMSHIWAFFQYVCNI